MNSRINKRKTEKEKSVNELEETIIDYGGVLVGSRALGVADNDNSDYDYIVRDTAAIKIYDFVDKHKNMTIRNDSPAKNQINNEDLDYDFNYGGLQSFYVLYDRKVYNIISLEAGEFNMWEAVSKMMHYCPWQIKSNRKLRRYFFHNTVDILKMLC